MRVLWYLGVAMIPGSFAWMIAVGGASPLLAQGYFWTFMGGVMLSASGGRRYRGPISPGCDVIGWMLASDQCPACGQSVFDSTPPSGYVPDTTRHTHWPARVCANCGHDLTKRLKA